ncbi:MAG: DUF2892 domain-containing protein [Methylotenera sp.]|nr:DUF2892 domain-containing protein [Methylotenera sp.]MDD4927047.1 DUF2892 domain-containing protein [Methylotenera sp.]
MIYVKNIPVWERWLRVIAGTAYLLGPAAYFDWNAYGIGLGTIGAMSVVTGLLGFCPIRAMFRCKK